MSYRARLRKKVRRKNKQISKAFHAAQWAAVGIHIKIFDPPAILVVARKSRTGYKAVRIG